MVVTFAMMCLACAWLAVVPVVLALALRAGKAAPLPPRLCAFYALALIGNLLSAVSSYWLAFGAPPHHPDLPHVFSFGGIGVYVMAFVFGLKPLRPALAAYLAANGGTLVAAVGSALWSPRRSLARMAERLPPPQ